MYSHLSVKISINACTFPKHRGKTSTFYMMLIITFENKLPPEVYCGKVKLIPSFWQTNVKNRFTTVVICQCSAINKADKVHEIATIKLSV